MKVEEKFLNILKEKTRSGFHDASLNTLCIDVQNRNIQIEIEHLKDSNKKNEEELFLSTFTFYNFTNLYLNNDVNCFGIEGEISSFENVRESDTQLFLIVGIKGWKVKFSALDFDYNEKFIETIAY